MKSNLNALYGAIQQVDRLDEEKVKNRIKKMPPEKECAKCSDKLMKNLNLFVEDENLKDFEEDLIGEL